MCTPTPTYSLPPIQWKHRSKANVEGQRARDGGFGIDSNPYNQDTEESTQWGAGWQSRDQAIKEVQAGREAAAIITPSATDDYILAHMMRKAEQSKTQRTLAGSLFPTDADYEVKSWPIFFSKMITEQKKHDMRKKADRSYRIGDKVLFREYDPSEGRYTGREAIFEITYITSNDTPCALSSNALDRDAVILSVDMVSQLFLTGKAMTAVQ